jgi:hypothetical protein
MSLLGETKAPSVMADAGEWEDSLFKTIDPTWSVKVEVLAVQRDIAAKVTEGSSLVFTPPLITASDEGPVLPGSDEAVLMLTSDPGGLLRSSAPDRRRLERRKRRAGIQRTAMVGRVVDRDDVAVGVLLVPADGTIGEDELAMRVPLRTLPPHLHSGLQPGAVFDFITDRWMTSAGKLVSESEFELREPREFSAEEQEAIERRAKELRAAIGEPSSEPVL